MTTIYFKTREAIDNEANKLVKWLRPQSVTCACGESLGYIIRDKKLVLCEACYDDAPYKEKGE